MGQFNHVRYVVIVMLAIGLFVMANIERHFPLTNLKLDDNFRILQEEMRANFWKGDEPDLSDINSRFDFSKMQTYEKSIEILRDEYITKIESLGRGIQSFQYTSYISMLLSANLILKWDSKVMLAIGLGGMSFCHLLIPTILPLANPLFIILCVLQGFFHGMIFPFFLTVTSFWSPKIESTTLISISMFGYYLGVALIETILLKLMSTNSDMPFYIFGALGLSWTVLWSFLAKGKPSDDPKITQTELKCILSDGNERGITTLTSSIRKRVFNTKSTVSIFLVIFCITFNSTIAASMVTFKRPNEMFDNTVLYSYLVAAFVTVAIALISDYLRKKCCLAKIRKIIICTGLLCSAIIMPFIGIYYPEDPTYYSVSLGSFLVVQTIIQTSCLVNLQDVVHHAAGYALGIFLGLASILAAVILIVTALVSALTLANYFARAYGNNLHQHLGNVIFWVLVGFNAVGCLIYAIFGSAKREIWAMNQAGTATETSIALKETSYELATPSNVYIVTD